MAKTNRLVFPKYFIIVPFLIFGLKIYAQNNELVLTDRSNGFTKIIHEGTKISICSNEGKNYKGKLKILNVSQIMVGSENIEIDAINSIDYRTRFTRITSSLLIAGGGVLIIAGGFSIAKAGSQVIKTNFNAYPVIGLMIAGGFITTSGIVQFIKSHKNKMEKWKFSVNVK